MYCTTHDHLPSHRHPHGSGEPGSICPVCDEINPFLLVVQQRIRRIDCSDRTEAWQVLEQYECRSCGHTLSRESVEHAYY